ncbi:uncharacterized protein LOC122262238 isoform X2 [Penaeus japonicus]|nr:uncharacterized protein LOC122262238 isoform X2 [Penaeus japonicus]XP_042886140.1 uncharacterized protein LOC122262238 isoform X2 [Penaeus japonicus]XP_042886141.1 uncharacterized protein LOC122262238 isoform X2 [Penaeus japonicus]
MEEEPFADATETLAALAHKLKEDLPVSASMHNSILIHARGHAEDFTFYTLSKHPDAHVVLWLDQERKRLALHCRKTELDLLAEALQKTQLLDWQSTLVAFHVPDYIQETLQEVARARSGKEFMKQEAVSFAFHQPSPSEPLKCKAGWRVCRLGREGVRHMLETSKFQSQNSLEAMLRFLRAAPSVGVYRDPDAHTETVIDVASLSFGDDQERPIAWISTSAHGNLGVLMTEEEHRGQGLGSLVTQVAARMLETQGYIPVVYVEPDNIPSLGMFSKLDGWKECHRAAWMLHFHARSGQRSN